MLKCPRCDQELKSGAPGGLCPSCLIEGAFETSEAARDLKTQTISLPPIGVDDEFDRYRIVKPLGEGGMGTVYLAEQNRPIRRLVALKVVKPGMDTAQVLSRFANERQALAVMDHPNIARIFDAGSTRRGRPYFVMEYIEGEPVTRYCDRKKMSVGKRLELFCAVCLAVEHAHRQGVIHRDLKPSNILVKDQEGAPVPKIIDFGIAKATDQRALDDTLVTQFGQMLGTPEYASPEQANMESGAILATSDIYSLGVILYELLTGSLPFDAERIRRLGLIEVLRVIREEEAPSLTRMLNMAGTAITDIAARRQVDVPTLRRLADGDLNSIALKALEKAPVQRYASAEEFAKDIRRYLERAPVQASSPGPFVRARKFLQRYKSALLTPATSSGSRIESTDAAAQSSASSSKVPIVLGGVANNTGETAFDGKVRQMIAAEVGKFSRLKLQTDVRMKEVLQSMRLSGDATLTFDVAADICERTGSAAFLEGWISRLGGRYVLGLRATSATGEVLHEEQSAEAKQADVFKALVRMAEKFGIRAGELLTDIKREPSLPSDVTTSSRDAWRSYSAAMKAYQTKAQSAEIVSLLNRAIEEDPNFAMAYAMLGRTQADLGEPELAAVNVTRAYELRNQVSDRESLFITFTYHRQMTRNLELCRQVLESWSHKYPQDLYPHGFLSGFTSPGTGRYQRAIEAGLKAIELDPNFAIGYENVAFAYLYLDRPGEAAALLERAAGRRIEVVQLSIVRYFISFLRNDRADMERVMTERRARFEGQGWFEHQEAMTLAYEGRIREANRLSARSLILARQAGLAGRAAAFQGAAALWNALFGHKTEAKRASSATLASFRSRDTDYGPAVAMALCNRHEEVLAIIAELERSYPEDTCVQFSYLPVLHCLAALSRGNPSQALEMTQAAIPYDFAVPGTAYFTGSSFFGALYPVYARGLAQSRMGQYREAAAEFQKILGHPGIMLNDPVGPLAHLQLARALSAVGDQVEAVAIYTKLLEIWRHADADSPVLQEARAEFAQLTNSSSQKVLPQPL
jgi:serine/threonine protein kinase